MNTRKLKAAIALGVILCGPAYAVTVTASGNSAGNAGKAPPFITKTGVIANYSAGRFTIEGDTFIMTRQAIVHTSKGSADAIRNGMRVSVAARREYGQTFSVTELWVTPSAEK